MLGAIAYLSPWLSAGEPVALFLHRITPARQTLDYGKSKLGLDWDERDAVETAVEKLAAPWIKHCVRQLKGKRSALPAEPKPERVTFQDAAFEAMADAYGAASSDGAYPVLSQQLFYAARPTILKLTGKDELNPGERSRFCYTLLPQFVQENAELTADWGVLYKPRGELIEPHTYRRIGLGTTEVASYRARWTNGIAPDYELDVGDWLPDTSGPHNRFGAVLVVEKGGIADLLRQIGVDRRHDVAIVGNEGQSVEAELHLIDALGPAGVPVFTLTDFDRQGVTIAENLRAGTWRHRYATPPEVVQVGLRLDQINDLGGLASEQEGGLEDEPIGANTLKHVGDDRLRACGATEAEIEVLGRRRVELNALATEQLVELVETVFAEHGVAKIVPGGEDLTAAWRAAKAHAEVAVAVDMANRRAAKRWQKASAPEDLEDRVRDQLEADPELAWDDALRRIAGRRAGP